MSATKDTAESRRQEAARLSALYFLGFKLTLAKAEDNILDFVSSVMKGLAEDANVSPDDFKLDMNAKTVSVSLRGYVETFTLSELLPYIDEFNTMVAECCLRDALSLLGPTSKKPEELN